MAANVNLQSIQQRLGDRTRFPVPFSIDRCVIDVSTLFQGANLKEDGNHLLGLSGLDPLRTENEQEEFLPKVVFVRDDMRTIFSDLSGSTHLRRKVLIGAPGVGKSVLFFFVALYRAKHEKKVLYYRRTQVEENVSVFYMEPGDGNEVNVYFTRNMPKEDFTVKEAHRVFRMLFGLAANDCLKFVDGPNHSDNDNLLENTFSALCTSGGYPVPPEEVWRIFHLNVLNGWAQEQFVKGLHALCGVDEEVAKEVYSLCGGRIRRGLEALENEAIVKTNLDRMIKRANKDMIELALTSTLYSQDRSNSDRLRTMFVQNSTVTQIVDSRCVLNGLQQRMTTDDFLKAYRQAKAMGLQGVSGVYFEELLHCWFRTSKPGPVIDFFRDNSLSGAESVAKLTERLVYWVPGVQNFANIDSALVVGTTLYCFQFFVGASQSFQTDTFWQGVGFPLTDRFNIAGIRMYWVVPSTSTFQESWMVHTFHFNEGGKTKATRDIREVDMMFYIARIDVDNLDESLAQFGNFE